MLDVSALNTNHSNLAQVFKKHWQTQLSDFVGTLQVEKSINLEKELKEAFLEEWIESGISMSNAEKLIQQLESYPVLQTSHHVTPTNGPTFLAYDLIASASFSEEKTYLVAASTGVPFSNAAWTGALSYGDIPLDDLLEVGSKAHLHAQRSLNDRIADGNQDKRISIIPSKQRDQLVFGTKIQDFQLAMYNQLSNRLKGIIKPVDRFEIYSHWACDICSHIQQKILNRSSILYFDINRVISKYLVKVLKNTHNHLILEILFSSDVNELLNKSFGFPVFFLTGYKGKKSFKIESLRWVNGASQGDKSGERKYTKEELIDDLENYILCPGIFLQFLVLRFINGIKCLGSFNQLEYLEDYRKRWQELDFDFELKLEPDVDESLTTGRLLDDSGTPIWPLDTLWNEKVIKTEEYSQKPMSFFWEPILKQLTKNSI